MSYLDQSKEDGRIQLSRIKNELFIVSFNIFRHQISHYTQQLSKDTSHNLKELNEIRTYSSQTDQVCYNFWSDFSLLH